MSDKVFAINAIHCKEKNCPAPHAQRAKFSISESGKAGFTFWCGAGHKNEVSCEEYQAVTQTTPDAGTDTACHKLRTKVSGVTFDNPDGTSRQKLLEYVKAGDQIRIVSRMVNCKRVFLVKHTLGVLGTLKGELIRAHITGDISNAFPLDGEVVCVTGGEGEKTTRGCNIEVTFKNAKPERTEEAGTGRELVYIDRDGSNIFHADKHCSGLKKAERVSLHYASKVLEARPCKKCTAKLMKGNNQ